MTKTTDPGNLSEKTVCPLCQANHLQTMDVFPTRDLSSEYRRQFGMDVSREFPSGLKSFDLCKCLLCGLEFFDPLIAGSAGFYSNLSENENYYSTTRWEFAKGVELVSELDHVIDVGCGDGHFLSLLPSSQKMGLELNPEAVAKAQARGLKAKQCGLNELEDQIAGAITLFQVLEHIPHPRPLLEQAVRVLRPDGLLIVAVPNNDAFVGEALQEPLNAPPHHPLRWGKSSLEYLPKVLPLILTRLELEPLALEHAFFYRKTRITNSIQKVLGHPLPKMKLNPGTIFARKLANALAMISVKIFPARQMILEKGFSCLAVYRKISG